MKARLPQGMGGGGAANLQQLARQAQKMQEKMEEITAELEAKEYTATSGGGAVSVTVTGKMEIKAIDIKPRSSTRTTRKCSAISSRRRPTRRCAAAAGKGREARRAFERHEHSGDVLRCPAIMFRR